jgi:predicted CopG family antitoxin
MAVKTITIDMEAYDLLARRKAAGQSFSQVIKAHFGRLPTAADLLARVRRARFSEEALDAMSRQVAARRRSPARAAGL